MLGSIVASAVETSGLTRSVRLEMPDKFALSVVIPNFALPTKESRAVLPECYSRADATYNIQRAALLTAALATGDASTTGCTNRSGLNWYRDWRRFCACAHPVCWGAR